MKKKTIITIIKVVAVAVWLFALLFPTIFANSSDVEYVDLNQVDGELQTHHYFEVEFSKKVAEGEVTIEFYNAEYESVYVVTLPFEGNDSNKVVVSIDANSVPDTATNYDFIGAEVMTPAIKTMNNIMYVVSIAMIFVVVFALRIFYRE